MSDILKLARQLSECDAALDALRATNRPVSPEDKVRVDTRCYLLRSARDIAYAQYHSAVASLTVEEITGLANFTPTSEKE